MPGFPPGDRRDTKKLKPSETIFEGGNSSRSFVWPQWRHRFEVAGWMIPISSCRFLRRYASLAMARFSHSGQGEYLFFPGRQSPILLCVSFRRPPTPYPISGVTVRRWSA
jgi:hypothetical protein